MKGDSVISVNLPTVSEEARFKKSNITIRRRTGLSSSSPCSIEKPSFAFFRLFIGLLFSLCMEEYGTYSSPDTLITSPLMLELAWEPKKVTREATSLGTVN
jgi:hypothetical protein